MVDNIITKQHNKRIYALKCHKCQTIYSSDEPPQQRRGSYFTDRYFPNCPFCGEEQIGVKNIIPLWKYNLIKMARGGFSKSFKPMPPQELCNPTGRMIRLTNNAYQCSVCVLSIFGREARSYNYCPYCGVKMKNE